MEKTRSLFGLPGVPPLLETNKLVLLVLAKAVQSYRSCQTSLRCLPNSNHTQVCLKMRIWGTVHILEDELVLMMYNLLVIWDQNQELLFRTGCKSFTLEWFFLVFLVVNQKRSVQLQQCSLIHDQMTLESDLLVNQKHNQIPNK